MRPHDSAVENLQVENGQVENSRVENGRVENGNAESGKEAGLFSSEWFAITSRPQHEKLVAQALTARGFESFLPYFLAERRWSDRTKKIQVPLFPGYVFGRFEWDRRCEIVTIPGYRGVVSFGGKPAPVDPGEIEGLRRIVQADGLFEPHAFLKTGQKVRITRGPLTGVEGILIQTNSSYRVVVSVSVLQRSVAVTLDPATLAPCSETSLRALGTAACV